MDQLLDLNALDDYTDDYLGMANKASPPTLPKASFKVPTGSSVTIAAQPSGSFYGNNNTSIKSPSILSTIDPRLPPRANSKFQNYGGKDEHDLERMVDDILKD